jgi:hypothetical protein
MVKKKPYIFALSQMHFTMSSVNEHSKKVKSEAIKLWKLDRVDPDGRRQQGEGRRANSDPRSRNWSS